MKERIKELWRRDIQTKLCEDVDYFIIINSNGEVGAIEYSLLGSILVFSQYSFALSASEKFGVNATVEKVTRDELFDRFSDRFDFFELNSELYIDKARVHSQNDSLPSMDVIVEMFDNKISTKLSECSEAMSKIDKVLSNLEGRFSVLEHSLNRTVETGMKESSEKHGKYLRRKTGI